MSSVRHGYLAREILAPFGVGLLVFFVVFALGNVMMLADAQTGMGISVSSLPRALVYSLPALLAVLLPATWFFATLLGVGRLSAEGELRAMAALGMPMRRLLFVPVVGGVIVGLSASLLGLYGEPWGFRSLKQLMSNGAQSALLDGVRAGRFYSWMDGVSFYAREGSADDLQGVLLTDRRDEGTPLVISGKTGALVKGEQADVIALRLRDGEMFTYDEAGSEQDLMVFNEGTFRFDVGALVSDKLSNVNSYQIKYPEELWREGSDPAMGAAHRAGVTVTLQRKFATALSTILFSIIALPLALRPSRGARARGLIISVAVVAGYYYVGRGLELSARAGNFSAVLAAWVPCLLSVLILLAAVRGMERKV